MDMFGSMISGLGSKMNEVKNTAVDSAGEAYNTYENDVRPSS